MRTKNKTKCLMIAARSLEMKQVDICIEYGVSRKTAYNICKEYGGHVRKRAANRFTTEQRYTIVKQVESYIVSGEKLLDAYKKVSVEMKISDGTVGNLYRNYNNTIKKYKEIRDDMKFFGLQSPENDKLKKELKR